MPETERYRGDHPDLLDKLRILERRISALERTPQLVSTSIGSGGIRVQGGAITIQNADGTEDLAILSSDGIFFGGEPLLLVGSVNWYAGPLANLPTGWLVCDGSAVSRTGVTAALFAEIGTTWGVGDGVTTFNLPNLLDRSPIGAGLTYTVGQLVGSATHVHTNPNVDAESAHTHTQGNTGSESSHTHTQNNTGSESSHTHTQGSTGGGGDHSHGGATGLPNSINRTAAAGANLPDDLHSHGISSSGTHTHTNPTTSAGSSHSHTNPTTDGGSSHAHTNPTTSAGSSHAHAQDPTGSTSSLQPSAALIPIIRY